MHLDYQNSHIIYEKYLYVSMHYNMKLKEGRRLLLEFSKIKQNKTKLIKPTNPQISIHNIYILLTRI